jgi:hypothetical protein
MSRDQWLVVLITSCVIAGVAVVVIAILAAMS